MAWKRVTTYCLGYSIPKKQFYFYYTLLGEDVAHQIFTSPEECVALGNMFRNEGPINFNTEGEYFVSAAEELKEQEANP